ncbi:MAG: CBS domain-containing protein [Armatimonadota bacterium]
MLAKEVMEKNVITVKPDTPVKEIAKLLYEKNISGLPVVDEENNILGIVSETDLITKVSGPHLPPHIQLLGGIIYLARPHEMEDELKKILSYTAEQIMTKELLTVAEEETVEDVASLMVERQVNRVPVLKDGKLTGIITRHDLIKVLI